MTSLNDPQNNKYNKNLYENSNHLNTLYEIYINETIIFKMHSDIYFMSFIIMLSFLTVCLQQQLVACCRITLV